MWYEDYRCFDSEEVEISKTAKRKFGNILAIGAQYSVRYGKDQFIFDICLQISLRKGLWGGGDDWGSRGTLSFGRGAGFKVYFSWKRERERKFNVASQPPIKFSPD